MQKLVDKELYQNKYREKLKEYGWIIPYKMEIKELYTILNNVKTKKDFTDKLKDFFNVEILEKLFNDIIILEKEYQREITIQIKNAIDSKLYILANNCLMSLIDNNLSFYLKDKSNARRQFIIEKLINKISTEKKVNIYIQSMSCIYYWIVYNHYFKN